MYGFFKASVLLAVLINGWTISVYGAEQTTEESAFNDVRNNLAEANTASEFLKAEKSGLISLIDSRKIFQARPDDPEARVLLSRCLRTMGRIYEEAKKRPEAEENYRASVKLFSDFQPGNDAECLAEKAAAMACLVSFERDSLTTYRYRKKFSEVLKLAGEAARIDASSQTTALVYAFVVLSYLKKNRFDSYPQKIKLVDEAIQKLDRVGRANSEYPEVDFCKSTLVLQKFAIGKPSRNFDSDLSELQSAIDCLEKFAVGRSRLRPLAVLNNITCGYIQKGNFLMQNHKENEACASFAYAQKLAQDILKKYDGNDTATQNLKLANKGYSRTVGKKSVVLDM